MTRLLTIIRWCDSHMGELLVVALAVGATIFTAGTWLGFHRGKSIGFVQGQQHQCRDEGKVLHDGHCWRQAPRGDLVRLEMP